MFFPREAQTSHLISRASTAPFVKEDPFTSKSWDGSLEVAKVRPAVQMGREFWAWSLNASPHVPSVSGEHMGGPQIFLLSSAGSLTRRGAPCGPGWLRLLPLSSLQSSPKAWEHTNPFSDPVGNPSLMGRAEGTISQDGWPVAPALPLALCASVKQEEAHHCACGPSLSLQCDVVS